MTAIWVPSMHDMPIRIAEKVRLHSLTIKISPTTAAYMRGVVPSGNPEHSGSNCRIRSTSATWWSRIRHRISTAFVKAITSELSAVSNFTGWRLCDIAGDIWGFGGEHLRQICTLLWQILEWRSGHFGPMGLEPQCVVLKVLLLKISRLPHYVNPAFNSNVFLTVTDHC